MKIRVLVFLSSLVLFSGFGWTQDANAPMHDVTSYTVTGLVLDGANYNGLSSNDTQTLSNEIIGTGVKWVMLSTEWFYSEPHAPTTSCQPNQGPDCYCGPKAACHNYNFTALDQLVNALHAAGINVGIRFALQPTWAGGNSCQGFCNGGGVILSSYMNTFSNNLYDLAHNMATRYKGKVSFWAIWNEPNQAGSFSPQDLNAGGGYITNEYMVLIQFPANAAILTVIPGALMVGPELYTPSGGGDQNTCDYWGHCATVYEWETSMLQYFHAYFSIFSIHNYSNNTTGQFAAISNTMNIMNTTGEHPIMWLTEFNYGNGTCSLNQNTILSYINTYYTNTIVRSFYYETADGEGTTGPSCGYGLAQGQWDGWAEKVPLYSGFESIVKSLP